MDDKDWAMLKIINEERNLTKSAQRLFISQPALTYRLHSLEQEFSVKILNRYPTGVSFTLEGECILKLAEDILDKISCTKKYIQNIEPPVEGPLRLGVSSVFAKFKMAPILKEYKRRFPDVELSLKTGSSVTDLPQMLQNQEIDIAIIRGDFNWSGQKHLILEEPFCIVASQPLELNDLTSLPWIQYEKATLTKAEIEYNKWWNEHFDTPIPPITRVDSIEACIQLVSYGIGWTILPRIHLQNNRRLFSRPATWRNGHPMIKKTYIAYRKEKLNWPTAKTFVDYVLHQSFS